METPEQIRMDDSAAATHGNDAKAAVRAVIQDMYPSLTDAERSAAEANLLRYFEIAIRIAEHAEDETAHLTAGEPLLSINERSKSNFQN